MFQCSFLSTFSGQPQVNEYINQWRFQENKEEEEDMRMVYIPRIKNIRRNPKQKKAFLSETQTT